MDLSIDIAGGHYIFVTPVKNEEDNLPKLAKSILKQTLKPALWVIVDDGSNDGTAAIIKNIESNHEWVKSFRLPEGVRELGVHLSRVCKEGFNFAINYCEQHSIPYEYIGLVDADIILENQYFKKLIYEFEKYPNLGIASGRGSNIIGKCTVQDRQRDDLPTGGARLWRKSCFEDTGGYLLTKSPDSVSNVKAMLKGWKTRQFNHIRFVSTRGHASAEGYWKGYKQFGINNYFIGYTLAHALLKAIKLLFEKPHYTGFAYFYGYFICLILGKERIDDKEVRYYFRYIRPHEIGRHYIDHLRKIFSIKKGLYENLKT